MVHIRQAGIPTVAALISGRPIILGDALDRAEAFFAAWLPGTGGLRDIGYPFWRLLTDGKALFYLASIDVSDARQFQ